MRFASGSKPVMPRHQMRRRSGGSDPSASRQSHRFAAAGPYISRRRANSARKSSSTSSRSANGSSARKIAAARNGRRGGRRRRDPAITARLSFYIVETGTKGKGFTISRTPRTGCPRCISVHLDRTPTPQSPRTPTLRRQMRRALPATDLAASVPADTRRILPESQ